MFIMAVPPFTKFLFPVLKNSYSEISAKELREICAKELNLSEEDLKEKTKKQNALKYADRTYWSIAYLNAAKLIEKISRGVIKITQRGKDLLDTNIVEITEEDLMQFEEFRVFKSGSSSSKGKSKPKEELTPVEKIQETIDEVDELVKSELLSRILDQDPYFFENAVIDLLKSMGYAGADNFSQVTKKSGDGGIDGLLNQDKLGLDVVYVQAKRYKLENKIQGKEMRDFVGSLDVKGANKGIFITTSDFANNALETIRSSTKKIITINGEELTNLMLDYNVGIKDEKLFKIKKIDEDYFPE